MRNIVCKIILNLDQLFSESGYVVKRCSYLELWRPSCSAEISRLGIFCRGHCEEHFYKFLVAQEEMSFFEIFLI